ncbi:MAG: PAS domain S-box protein, partial [Desulfomonilaceae bacterium]
MSFNFKSLRYRLTFLLILGLIPCVVLTLYGNIEQRRLSLIRAQETALQSATDFAEVLGFVIEETRRMLKGLAEEPEIQDLDKTSCSQFFNDKFFKHVFPMYSNLGLVNLKGQLVCGVFSGLGMGEFSDQPYFKEVLQTKRFSVDLVATGKPNDKRVLAMAYPVLSNSGSLRGVVFCYLELSWLNHLVNHAGLPTHATLTVIDKTGNVLARSLNAEKLVGRPAPDAEIIQKVLSQGKGLSEAIGVDGIKKIYGFEQVGVLSKDLYVYVGIPKSEVISAINRLLFFDLLWLTIAILMAIAAVWFFTHYLITRQMEKLVEAINKIAGGNLNIRTGMDQSQGEIGFLGSAFDRMVEAIQDRELERQRSNEALKKEKQFSEMVIDSLPGIFYLFDSTGKMIRWNHNTENITGYSAEEISKMNPLDFVLEQEQNLLAGRIKDALELGEASMEAHYVTKSGMSIPFYFTGKIAEIDKQKCVIGVGIDISIRKKVEKELADSEQILKTILAASPVGIHVANKREIKWANEAWIKMLGYEEEKEYVGQSASILYQSDEEFERVGRALYTGLKSTNVTETEAKIKRKDGTFFDAAIRIARLNTADPEKESIVAVITDISERKRHERELSESEERYKNLVETMNEGLGMFDERGIVTYVNKRACEILGYSQDE